MIWLEAKTNWLPTDYINVEDFNRIRNNIGYIQEKAIKFFDMRDSTPLIGEKTRNDLPYPQIWNNLEDILDEIIQSWEIEDMGFKKTFYILGDYIDYNELNRLESATLKYKEFFENQHLTTLSFKLGNYGGIEI